MRKLTKQFTQTRQPQNKQDMMVSTTAFNSFQLADEATVTEVVRGPHQVGRVSWQGSWWPAKCVYALTLPPSTVCRVVGVHNITLFVEPINFTSQELSVPRGLNAQQHTIRGKSGYTQRNQFEKSVDWQFTTTDARIRLKRLYPQVET
jgi:hypothetical protein